jgi:hypothetical protein
VKYFTHELVARLNSPDPAVADQADREWEESLARYQADLETIRLLLPEPLLSLDLHDGGIERIALEHGGDGVTEPGLCVSVRQPHRRSILRYRGIRRASLEYDPLRHPFPGPVPGGLGDWLVDELSWVGDRVMRHEVLLETGTLLLCEFTVFDLEKDPL